MNQGMFICSQYARIFLKYSTNKKFWEELITYFPLIHDYTENDSSSNSRGAAGTSLPSCHLAMIGGHTDTRVQQFLYCCVYSFPLERVFRAVALQQKDGYTLPSRCLAKTGGLHIHRLMGGIYKERRLDGLKCH
jgi:hypothetical protein